MSAAGKVEIPKDLLGHVAVIAAAAPLRRNRYALTAGIPWHLIETLRDELDELGVDWRRIHTTWKTPRGAA